MASYLSKKSSLEQLQQVFNNVLLVDARAMGSALGIPSKTILNSGDAFPVPFVKFGRRKYFRVIDIAAHLDSALGITFEEPQGILEIVRPALAVAPVQTGAVASGKRGRGRPRKAAGGAA